MTLEYLQKLLNSYDDGLLRLGKHKEGREFCALEFESKVRGRAWSDVSDTLPDIRALNDAFKSNDRARTDAMLPLMVALWDWSIWTDARKRKWAETVVVRTVQEIISQLPFLNADIKKQCLEANNLSDAATAATATATYAATTAATYAAAAATAAATAAKYAAGYATGYAAAATATAAATAAKYAATAADYTAEYTILLACSIQMKAAEESETRNLIEA